MVIAMVIGRDLALSSMEGSSLCWNRFRFRHLCSTSSYVVKFAANTMPKRKTTFFRMITDIYFAKDSKGVASDTVLDDSRGGGFKAKIKIFNQGF
jgi:hypothetical protein